MGKEPSKLLTSAVGHEIGERVAPGLEGVPSGRRELVGSAKLFRGFAETISFSQHNVFNPRIRVDGDTAHGIWYFLGPFTLRKGDRQVWLAARYEDDYIKVDGTWKIQYLRAICFSSSPLFIAMSSSVAPPGPSPEPG